MWIITTHDVADFDAIASAFAARRLHPEAVVVRRRLTGPAERAFLALHKDRFESISHQDVDQNAVRGWIVVDVRRRARLADFARLLERVDARDSTLEVHVWDHHAASDDDLVGDVEHVEPVGAVTTLLVEEMRARGLEVDPIEATLYALGIHADTGSLTYASTTPRDAEAVAWLLRSGASLSVLNRYLRPALDAAQRDVLAELLGTAQTHRVGGVEVAMSIVTMRKAVNGLSIVTSQACELTDAAAFFGIFVIGRRGVQIVGRSSRGVVNVGAIMGALGGGGHAEAGSAVMHGESGEAVRDRVLSILTDRPPHPRIVRELMSSPVHTLRHDARLGELEETLAQWRHTGAPVMRDGKMVGIVSQRDVERAAKAGDLELPASSWMTAPARTIGPEASLDEALALMIKHDIGRLPVVDEGRLIGIVTRSDVLGVLYG